MTRAAPRASLRRPTQESLAAWLARQQHAAPTFDAPLSDVAPPGFDLDVYRAELGRGEEVFAAARDALFAWRHCELGWLEIVPCDAPPAPGRAVAMLARVAGVWFANACVVRRVFDEPGPPRAAGYEYVTLPGHVERGAERFSVLLAADGSVSLQIRAVSRPARWWVAAGRPLARAAQRRFGRQSPAALVRAVRAALDARSGPRPPR